MGWWGGGLFQSETQFDLISDASHEAGLGDLEKVVLSRQRAQKAAESGQPADISNDDANLTTSGEDAKPSSHNDDDCWQVCRDNGIYFSIWSAECSDIPFVREYLNNGALFELVQKTAAKVQDEWGLYNTGYQLLLIGACAMTLGCKLPTFLRNFMHKNYRSVGFRNAAIEQLRKALSDGPDEYKEGEPYEFKEPEHDSDCDCG